MSTIPNGGNFIFAYFETPRCQFCTKMPEMSDLCYLGKTRLLCNDNVATEIDTFLLSNKNVALDTFCVDQ